MLAMVQVVLQLQLPLQNAALKRLRYARNSKLLKPLQQLPLALLLLLLQQYHLIMQRGVRVVIGNLFPV
jgi:hypothetical protein